MYGDTLVMRRRAAQLREQGEDIRTMAEQLVTRSDEVGVAGRGVPPTPCGTGSASAPPTCATPPTPTTSRPPRSRSTSASATGSPSPSPASSAGPRPSWPTPAPASPGCRARPDDDAVRPTATREDQALVAFAPPPSGHKDWLDVELPGL